MALAYCNKLTLFHSHIHVARMAYAAGEYTAALKNLNVAEFLLVNDSLKIDDLALYDLKRFFGKVRLALSMYGQAEHDFQQALDLATSSSELSQQAVYSAQRHLADCIRVRGRFDQAESIYRGILATLNTAEPQVDHQLAKAHMGLAQVLIDRGNIADAADSVDKAMQLFEISPGAKSFWYGRALIVKARLRCAQKETVEANELLQLALTILEPLVGPDHPLAHMLVRQKNEPVNITLAELKNLERQLKDHELAS